MNRFGKWIVLCVSIAALAFGNAASGGSEGSKAPAASGPITVEKAKGADAYTVSETYENAGKLDKKTVVVRGKVAKVSKGIMGKNWVHLRDGSGDAGKGTNNLVVTTQDVPDVGAVVTAKGTLHKDKDFGAGYKYKVIVEEATVKQ
ncbi:MAG: hypothetical protein H6R41_257 [Deltaproteobacteria bacterium]|nr:hypothetical protein [Deltaproteobacteria bacterium]MBP2688124.1 hypothetical protein [Deltaproteobacteria bacterium]MBS1243720.1 hypothetical protein [Deltaproteobacteria bacterium]